MASAGMKDELSCSICLNVYTDPVTLRCGHNFCHVCIDRVLDAQEGSGSYSCPECRGEFTKRPALQRNITLCNIAERFHSTWRESEDKGISCTYCVDSPVPAVKSCLLCEAYLCEKHLRAHSKSPEHVLTDPNTSLEGRKCPVHKKILEYYCTTDGACVCVSCSLAGEHRGHQVEMLGEACEKKKAMLRKEVQKAITERNEVEVRVLSLQEHKNKVQQDATIISEKATALLRKKLEDLEKNILDETSRQTSSIFLELSDQTQQLEIKKYQLSTTIQNLEELCNMTDPLIVLQTSGPIDLHEMSSAELPTPLPDLTFTNLDVNKIHSALHKGLDNAVSEIKRIFPVTPVVHHAQDPLLMDHSVHNASNQPNNFNPGNLKFKLPSAANKPDPECKPSLKWLSDVVKHELERQPTSTLKLPSDLGKPKPDHKPTLIFKVPSDVGKPKPDHKPSLTFKLPNDVGKPKPDHKPSLTFKLPSDERKPKPDHKPSLTFKLPSDVGKPKPDYESTLTLKWLSDMVNPEPERKPTSKFKWISDVDKPKPKH